MWQLWCLVKQGIKEAVTQPQNDGQVSLLCYYSVQKNAAR